MNKLYRCNEELTELKEWCIARDKKEAYDFMNEFWDCGTIMKDYFKQYKKINKDKKLKDFIEYFFIEEDENKDFTHPYGDENNNPVTKKVHEWTNIVGAPDYLCHEEW